MTKKDLIIIAVLANMAVLAILFMLAIRVEEPAFNSEEVTFVVEDIEKEQPHTFIPSNMASNEPLDEMDALLSKNNTAVNSNIFTMEEDIPLLDLPSPEIIAENKESESQDFTNLVEVTVKRGDALEKLARSNGTTVEAIKKANNLTTDRLKIGQVLQIPVGQVKESVLLAKKEIKNPEFSGEQYYTIKNGDNPWKIAKQFHMKVDELLKLNELDEDKARNLKIGDQIRVK